MSGALILGALTALPQVISAFQSGSGVVASLVADAEAEWAGVKNNVTILPATIAADDAALDAADATLQAAEPAAPS